jgi:hypothetical protein
VDVAARKVLVKSPSLRGGHNLVRHLDEYLVNSSPAGDLVRVSLDTGARRIPIGRTPAVREKMRIAFARYNAQRQVGRLIKRLAPSSRPFFLRGLAVNGARVFIGTSPAGVVEFDLSMGVVVSLWFFSSNVRESVHGLCVLD